MGQSPMPLWSDALAHAESHTLPSPEKLDVGGIAGKLGVPGLFIGVIALVVAAWKSFSTPATETADLTTHFFHAYLSAYAFFMAITLGSLAFVIIQHLTRAGWSVTVRRVAEGMALNFFLLVMLTLVFFIPVHGIDGAHRLFPHWFYPDSPSHDAVLHAKSGYLNPQF